MALTRLTLVSRSLFLERIESPSYVVIMRSNPGLPVE